jgi:hypothetical protein
MRLPNLCWLLLIAALSFGCKKTESTVNFVVVDKWTALMDVTAPPSGPQLLYLATSRINSTYADTCRRHKITSEQLQRITLQEATLTVDAPPGQNFDFLRQLTFLIMSEQGNDQIPLASITNVPRGATRLTLTPTTEGLQAYLRSGVYFLKPQLELSQPGQAVARVQLQLRYQVQVRR